MRRFLILSLFVCISTLVQAQIIERLPPARPLFNLPDTATIFIMGDVMMHADQIANARKKDGTYSFSTYLANMESRISEADIAVANMEFTLGGKPYTGYPSFSAPDGYEDYVASTGVDVFLTANNHIYDKGRKGLLRTLERYSQMEADGLAKHTGCSVSEEDDGNRFPLIVVARGVRIALVNFTYGTNQESDEGFPKIHLIDKEEIARAVRKAKDAGADFVVALPHWGIEYRLIHSHDQEKLARWLADQGCDAVVGAHPHVVQDAAFIETGSRKVPVVYSLGNVVSNMSAENTQVGLSVRLRIATDLTGERTMLPPEFCFTWCSRPGKLTDSYTVVPIKDFIGKREAWKDPADYDNMVASYVRVKAKTGIKD